MEEGGRRSSGIKIIRVLDFAPAGLLTGTEQQDKAAEPAPAELPEGARKLAPIKTVLQRPELVFANWISRPGCVTITGRTRSGKSSAAEYLYYYSRNMFAWGILFSQASFNTKDIPYINQGFKKERYDPLILREAMEEQKKIPEDERPLIFIHFDDCVSDLHHGNDKALFELATQATKYNIFSCFVSQGTNKLPNYVRENAYQILTFKMYGKNEIEAAYESYGQDLDTVGQFKQVVNKPLQKYEFCYFDRMNPEMECKALVMKMPPYKPPPFMLKTGVEEIDNPERALKRKREQEKRKRKRSGKRRKTDSDGLFGDKKKPKKPLLADEGFEYLFK